MEFQNKLDHEKTKNNQLREENLNTQFELKELRDEALEYKITLQKELQLKKKRAEAQKRRKRMKSLREASKSLALERAGMASPSASKNGEDPYMSIGSRIKLSDLENFI